ncbi:MAG TPA: hypothetical protein ENN09_01895, partial [Planctomycetes bacterium]|nr:hypothetical protein [Planctomycetota bacterium]
MYRLFALLAAAAALAGCAPAAAGTPNPGARPAETADLPAELPSVAVDARRIATKNLDGIETSDGWFPEDWGNPVEVTRKSSTELGNFLKLDAGGGQKDKSAAGLIIYGKYGSGQHSLRLDLYNPGPK